MVTTTVNVHEAKTNLSKLLRKVAQGEEVIIANAGKPAARLIPIEPEPAQRRIGFLKGRFLVPDDIKAPFAGEIEEMFYGNPDKFNK